MTAQETRQLGIEFERRVQTMIPEKEFVDKLDTETIYSYLNQYQDKYVHEIYRGLDNVQSGTKLSAHIDSVLLSLLCVENYKLGEEKTASVKDSNDMPMLDTGKSYRVELSDNFYMYVRSVTKVSTAYGYNGKEEDNAVLPNELVSQNDVWKLIRTPHDSLRILRYPAVVLDKKVVDNDNKKATLTLICDRYTTPVSLSVVYYKQPDHFTILNNPVDCELPMDAFDDIVTGAVELYVNYVAGAEAKKKQQQEAAEKRAREDQRDARRSGGNQDEQQ